MMPIPIRNKFGDVTAWTWVSDEDFAGLVKFRWCSHGKVPAYVIRGAARADGVHQTLYMHREIMRPGGGLVVDHVNGNKLDNRRENLRVCTKSQNQFNRKPQKHPKHGSSRGVSFYKRRGRWVANICFYGKREGLGCYDTEAEAAAAYQKRAKEVHGEFYREDAAHAS